jgi:hypothetical protein
MVGFTPQLLYPQGMNRKYPVDGRLGGPQSWSDAADKRKIPYPCGNRILAVQHTACHCTDWSEILKNFLTFWFNVFRNPVRALLFIVVSLVSSVLFYKFCYF